jgi:chromosome partitioning protein
MTVTVSLINMEGGVGKRTLAFNLAWFSAWRADLRVLAVDRGGPAF